jgi:hypothetical protein
MAGSERVDVLARRVLWLDRNRHALAVAGAMLMLPIAAHFIAHALGPEWPRFHADLIGGLVAVLSWIAGEVGLAWLAALWETEHDRRVHDERLPRATLTPLPSSRPPKIRPAR